jgi:uncharacterized surface anchored protein
MAACIGTIAQQAPSTQASLRHTSAIDLLVLDTSGHALPGAAIKIADDKGVMQADGLTNRLGKFYISDFPAGLYQLTVWLTGFKLSTKPLSVKEHFINELNVTLINEAPLVRIDPDFTHHGDSRLELLVTDETGVIIPKAHVSVIQDETSNSFSGLTDEKGRYSVSNLAPGDYALQVTRFGFCPYTVSVSLRAHEPHAITARLAVARIINYALAPSAN